MTKRKAPVSKTAPEVNTEVVEPEVAEAPKQFKSKMEYATFLYNTRGMTHSRKQLLELFVSEVGLTKAGASTYYHSIGLKNKKAV